MVDFATETIQPRSHLLQGFELALGLRLSTAFVFKQVPKSNPQLYGKKWGLEAPWSPAKLRSSTAGAISEAIIYFDFVCGGRETATSFESQTAESKASRSASCCSNSWMASGPGSSQTHKKKTVKFGNILGLIIRYMFSFVLNSLGAPEVCPDLLACCWSNHPGYGKGHVQGLQ